MGGREKLGAGADLGGVSPVVWLLPVGASPPKTRGNVGSAAGFLRRFDLGE